MGNKELPEKIQNAPEVLLGLELFFKAFLDLNSCRAIGYGEEGPIQWTAMAEYSRHHGFDEETEHDLFYLVRAIDVDYLKWKSERAKKEITRKDAGGKRK